MERCRLNIDSFIERNLKKYPLSTSVDIYKLLFQACNLTGHIISSDSYNYLLNEYHDSFNLSLHKELYEFIDSDVVRINLESFSFDLIELFNIVKRSSTVKLNKDFDKLLKAYGLRKMEGIPHHSDIYREKYHPSYRVCYLEYLPITYRIYKLNKFIIDYLDEGPLVIAVEGLPFSGKSAIASRIPDATIIDTTNQDLYMIRDLLETFEVGKSYSYKSRFGILEDTKRGIWKDIVIVQGRGSFMPFLRNYYSHMAYVVSDHDTMNKRNINGEDINKDILDYYRSYDFINKADILI